MSSPADQLVEALPLGRPFVTECLDACERVVESFQQMLVGLDGLGQQQSAAGGVRVPPAELRAHPVEGVDVLGLEHHPHLGQREPEQLLEIADTGHPGHVGRQVETLATRPVVARADETELLPVAERPGGHPGALGQLADAEDVARGERGLAAAHDRTSVSAPTASVAATPAVILAGTTWSPSASASSPSW